MGRRNRYLPAPSALGDNHVHDAINTIDLLCERTVNVMTEYSVSRDDTIRMLFEPDVLDRAGAAVGVIDPSTNSEDYKISGCLLHIQYLRYHGNYAGSAPWPTIRSGAMILQDSAAPLLHFIESVRAIYEQFEEIKAVLRWLNLNATPGAIRYYFPTASALCPNSPPLKALLHVPSRYTQPKDINDWMQMIKDAAACYASTQMLPTDSKPKDKTPMSLTFPQTTLTRGNLTIRADAVTFNI